MKAFTSLGRLMGRWVGGWESVGRRGGLNALLLYVCEWVWV